MSTIIGGMGTSNTLDIVGIFAFWSCFISCLSSAEPINFHAVRGRRPTSTTQRVLEAELDLQTSGNLTPQGMQGFGSDWSGDAQLLGRGQLGATLTAHFELVHPGRYQVLLRFTKAPDYGQFEVRVNGSDRLTTVDLYAPRVERADELLLSPLLMPAGKQEILFTLVGGHPSAKQVAKGYLFGLDYVRLERLDPPKPEPSSTIPRTLLSAEHRSMDFEELRQTLEHYCYRCHGQDHLDAGTDIDLTAFASPADFVNRPTITQRLWEVLKNGAMPPEDATPAPREVRGRLAVSLESFLTETLADGVPLAATIMRRLNRYEYNNAVRDLLQLRGDIYPLPEKAIRAERPYFAPAEGRFPSAIRVGNRTLGKNQVERQILTGVSPFAIDLQAEHGFNNRGSELSVSPLLLESFLNLAISIVESPEFDAYCELSDSLLRPPKSIDRRNRQETLRDHVQPFLQRAFRAPVSPQTNARYASFLAREIEQGHPFPTAMKRMIAAVIASPRFLYLSERPQVADQPAKVNPYELASRLSFFLWSSIPDETLLQAASTGDLGSDAQLRRQVHRMLEDPRSQALSENFARQWLRLDQLITAVPDFDRFPRYYARIGCEQWKFGLQTMLEPLLLFEAIMVEDRSVMLLIDSPFSYRSDELHSWYQDATPFPNRDNINRFNTNQQVYRRRTLETRREGGVITSAAILTMTSSPLRTNPIARGAWVATAIFNKPPPPPPDVIPEIEADDAVIEAQGLTLRQRLQQHQSNTSCASCHARIDPLGFALENFDAVGRWRDTYRSGLPIDASGKLLQEVMFRDVVELKEGLLAHPEWFLRAFSEHLLAYALGRELTLADRPAIDKIVRQALRAGGQFSTVVTAVATSYPFLHKANQRTAEALK